MNGIQGNQHNLAFQLNSSIRQPSPQRSTPPVELCISSFGSPSANIVYCSQ
ncbi:MAG: hypothetical protein P4L41_05885 [Flavipsychrobacter sp.]|nr:hypothetical protein [Flavipsychrobacter sp.]